MPLKIEEMIRDGDVEFTKLEQRVATYLIGRPEALALETSAEIAVKLDVSPMTVSRFFKKLGFERASELRTKARHEFTGPHSARVGDRYQSFVRAKATQSEGMDREIAQAGINAALNLRTSPKWQSGVRAIAQSDFVAIVGYQLYQYLASGLAMRLNYVRPGVSMVSGSDGVYTEVFSQDAASKCLLIIDMFRYASHGPVLAEHAKKNGYQVILMCDEFCDWGNQHADYVFTFPNEGQFFLPFPVGLHFGLNLLYQDVVYALGEIKRVIDEPGLYFKRPAPLQNVEYHDKRILTIDTTDSDPVVTAEKLNLVLDYYVKWRIADPIKYIRSVRGRESQAVDRILRALRDALQTQVAKLDVDAVISKERDKLMSRVLQKVDADSETIGVDVIDVRLKRVEYEESVRETVFADMRAERKKVADARRADGRKEKEEIQADADRQREVILANAYREAQIIKGEGDKLSAKAYADAFRRDADFAEFYRSLEAYRKSFQNKSDVLVLDPSSEFFKYFRSDSGTPEK